MKILLTLILLTALCLGGQTKDSTKLRLLPNGQFYFSTHGVPVIPGYSKIEVQSITNSSDPALDGGVFVKMASAPGCYALVWMTAEDAKLLEDALRHQREGR